MSDLVERLRDWNCHGTYPMCDEAADEIERLRAQIKWFRENVDRWPELAQAYAAELERLSDD